MALANITREMTMQQASSQLAENIIVQRSQFMATLNDDQKEVFRIQLENAFEVGWSCHADSLDIPLGDGAILRRI